MRPPQSAAYVLQASGLFASGHLERCQNLMNYLQRTFPYGCRELSSPAWESRKRMDAEQVLCSGKFHYTSRTEGSLSAKIVARTRCACTIAYQFILPSPMPPSTLSQVGLFINIVHTSQEGVSCRPNPSIRVLLASAWSFAGKHDTLLAYHSRGYVCT